MRFLLVPFLFAAVIAAPQYNYNRPNSGGFGGISSGSQGYSSGGSIGGFSSTGGSNVGFSSSRGFSGASGFGVSGGSSAGHGFVNQGGAAQHQTIVTKHFHSFAAPEEQEDFSSSRTISAGPARKHYRVVFIKAPAQSSHSAALQIAQAQNEEKTVIYVLSKKTDASEIAANIQQSSSAPSKPEVFFIKYKTSDEAAHAQRQIQAQYDSLGGTSQFSDEGVAPVSSVVGALGGGASPVGGGYTGASHGSGVVGGAGISGGSAGGSFVGSVSRPSSTYLPPN